MCYSALIKADLKTVSREFGASVDIASFESLLQLRLREPSLKIPLSLDRYFLLSQDPAEKRLAPLVKKFHEEEQQRLQVEVRAAQEELKALRSGKVSATAEKKKGVLERRIAKLESKRGLDRISPNDERIFPGVFAPVIYQNDKGRIVAPMRYRLRRPDGGEIPSQYNVFNARRDSLLSAPTWKPLLGTSHAIFPFVKFFEWVERGGKKQEIAFRPEERPLMWAASLYSVPQGQAALPYASFAMITDEPPAEVAQAGHDRCPIFLRSDLLDTWLRYGEKSPQDFVALLESKEKTFYLHALAA
ncbi:MAG TPA: SOS response-associated peptidase family protein [Bdellovibrionota bacterium]|jgi:putative SOS response-associated peptidase YedK